MRSPDATGFVRDWHNFPDCQQFKILSAGTTAESESDRFLAIPGKQMPLEGSMMLSGDGYLDWFIRSDHLRSSASSQSRTSGMWVLRLSSPMRQVLLDVRCRDHCCH